MPVCPNKCKNQHCDAFNGSCADGCTDPNALTAECIGKVFCMLDTFNYGFLLRFATLKLYDWFWKYLQSLYIIYMYHIICYNRYFYNDPSNQNFNYIIRNFFWMKKYNTYNRMYLHLLMFPLFSQQGLFKDILFPLNFKKDVVSNATLTYFTNIKLILCNLMIKPSNVYQSIILNVKIYLLSWYSLFRISYHFLKFENILTVFLCFYFWTLYEFYNVYIIDFKDILKLLIKEILTIE